MTSPWPPVFTSSPGMTTSLRPRARSAASSAPPRTLWSVTAIAPSPSASAWSRSSSTSIEQSCDHVVCMCRSTTILSRSSGGGAAAAARAGATRSRRRPPSTRSASAPKSRAAAAATPSSARRAGTRRPPSGAPPPRRRAPAAAARPGGAATATPAAQASSSTRGMPSTAGHEHGGLPQELGAARRRREPCAPASVRAGRGAPVGATRAGGCGGARAPSPAGRPSSRPSARRSGRSDWPPLEDDELPLRARLEERRSTPSGHELVAAGKALGGRLRRLRRSSRAARRGGRAAARAASAPAGTRAAPARRTSPPSARRCRGARGTRGSAGPARSRGRCRSRRRRARPRGSRGRRPERPIRLRREIGTAGPSATSSSSSRPAASARRPAARSRARFDGASTVTEWPRARSSRASPATCSFTSCGCDQAKGVTRATRSAIVPTSLVTTIRQKIVAAARWGIAHEPRIHYGEVRPIPLGRTLPLTTDCSGFVTLCYYLAGAPDPNGLGYSGEGWTGTLLGHLPPIDRPTRGAATSSSGAPIRAATCAIVLEPGDDPLLCSHGTRARAARDSLGRVRVQRAVTWLLIRSTRHVRDEMGRRRRASGGAAAVVARPDGRRAARATARAPDAARRALASGGAAGRDAAAASVQKTTRGGER